MIFCKFVAINYGYEKIFDFNHIFSALLLGSCVREPRTLITGYGDLDLTLTVNEKIKWFAQEQSFDLYSIEIGDFELELIAEDGSVKKLGTYAEFKSGIKKNSCRKV